MHLQPFTLIVNFYRVYLTVSFLPCVSPSPGFVVLPAGAIKDAEGVGNCSQVFSVSECQDGAGGSRVRSRVPPTATAAVTPRYHTHKYPISHTHILTNCSSMHSIFTISLNHLLILLYLSLLPPSLPIHTSHSEVELGIADPREDEWRDDVAQRSLLVKGDSFVIPPGNIYRCVFSI